MHYAFQDKDNLYLILDYLSGGDLRYHIIKRTKFSEEETTCIIVGLEYMHNKNILQRDIKPENLVFDKNGYLRITDFGISRIWSPRNESDTSGTPGYMAPEVMMKAGHGIACDIFALGVIGYECTLGKRPYVGSSRKEIRDNIIARQAKIHQSELPLGWSEHAIDFINKALMRKPSLRIGTDKPGALKRHAWFNDFDWEKLENKTMKSPFEGLKLDENISHYFKKTENNDDIEEKSKFHTNIQIQKLYMDYSFDIERYLKQKEMIKRMEEEREKEREKERQLKAEENNVIASGITGTTRGNTGITGNTKPLLTTSNSFGRIN